jgi:hypothetical protein
LASPETAAQSSMSRRVMLRSNDAVYPGAISSKVRFSTRSGSPIEAALRGWTTTPAALACVDAMRHPIDPWTYLMPASETPETDLQADRAPSNPCPIARRPFLAGAAALASCVVGGAAAAVVPDEPFSDSTYFADGTGWID